MKSSAAADVDLELLKAVAQAWHAQSGNPRPSRAAEKSREEHVGARPRAGAARYRPSRFKLEAMAAAASPATESPAPSERPWDFTRSLWDTYELVSVARKLESGLVIADYADDAPPAAVGVSRGEGKRGRESRRSLRRLLLRPSSRN
ncbi:hypothetical protein PR202_gb08957 [Eleusine coracana subsp. coracana]|uniref:Uncharacterized protein n=1 Tax=Eleusine coracana subsp. coracana TaxID=191504 RepID=A0AAV5EDN1_ELECO|nr:hypothetical protein QOZ80_2BG0191630 [Eleusine coracana subsp. coracana]GJN21478.1 hypothetical protein PR202_gb08957 [Eleusine coracana subsp. coracana]